MLVTAKAVKNRTVQFPVSLTRLNFLLAVEIHTTNGFMYVNHNGSSEKVSLIAMAVLLCVGKRINIKGNRELWYECYQRI